MVVAADASDPCGVVADVVPGVADRDVVVVVAWAGAAVVGGGAGAHVAAGSALKRGGGSLGLPAPFGWNRQPSVTVDFTRDDPGPTFEYVQPPLVPCQYDQ